MEVSGLRISCAMAAASRPLSLIHISVAAYRESLAVDPSFTEAMHGLARALQDLQRYDEAIGVAQKITQLDPDDVLAHTSLSVLYQKKGMIPEAEAEGAKARVLGWKQQLKKS